MAWVNITGTEVKYSDIYGSALNNRVAVRLQYEEGSETPERIKVRFKCYRYDGSTSNLHDSIFVLYNADSTSGRTLFLLKGNTTGMGNTISWDWYYSDSFYIYKDFDAEKFTVQDYWICNYGGTSSSNASSVYNAFKSGGARSTLCCRVDSSTFSVNLSKTVATAIGKGTIAITDNGNNTFSISGTKGAAGTNNPSSGPTLSWGYSTSYGTAVSNPTKLTINNNSDATRTVYAKCVTGATYGSGSTATTYKDIKQYVAPGNPGKPVVSSRLNLKGNWTYSWTAAEAANTSSPVKGYRVRIFKNGTTLTGLTYDKDTNIINKGSGTNQWIDTEETSTNITFDPVELGFEIGDKVKISLFSYSRNGKEQIAWTVGDTSYSLFNSTQIFSDELTVKNAGIIHTNVKDTWKEGQVYVNVKGTWKEAESVSVNVNGTWKESQ